MSVRIALSLALAALTLAPVAYDASPAAPAAVAPAEDARRLEPVDEATKDPSLVRFRKELLAAVERRDARYVRGAIDPAIKNGFGGDDGARAFERQWKPGAPDSELWDELREVLTRGGAFENGEFCAPYVTARFPEDLDAFDYYAVLDDGVALRERPEADAPAVATLSYHLVKVDPRTFASEERPAWFAVATTDGREGYLPAASLRSPVDYRAYFAKRRGRWRMTAFLAGD